MGSSGPGTTQGTLSGIAWKLIGRVLPGRSESLSSQCPDSPYLGSHAGLELTAQTACNVLSRVTSIHASVGVVLSAARLASGQNSQRNSRTGASWPRRHLDEIARQKKGRSRGR